MAPPTLMPNFSAFRSARAPLSKWGFQNTRWLEMTAQPIPFPEALPRPAPMPRMIRAEGQVRAGFISSARGTALSTLYESGGYRLKFPRGDVCEAVLVNTGGGMAGGDRLAVDLHFEGETKAVITTQSAEKIYRADGQGSEIDIALNIEARAQVTWLPQEMILFSGARLSRRFTVDMKAEASLTLFESTIFGRVAMGETITEGLFRDRWRVRREGRLIFADDVLIENNIAAHLDRKAVGKGARAVGTCLFIAPDAEARLEEARQALHEAPCECAASAWNGMMIVRFVARDPVALRRSATQFLSRFRNTALPRVWQC